MVGCTVEKSPVMGLEGVEIVGISSTTDIDSVTIGEVGGV